MNITGFEEFCGGPFWNQSSLVDNSWPEFTPCFINTVLVWIPCGYVWLLLPYFLYDVNNKRSTNNMHAGKFAPQSKSVSWQAAEADLGKATKNDGLDRKEGKLQGNLTAVCFIKIILTCLMAVLAAVFLLFDIKNKRPASEIFASALYIATYILIAFMLWYERMKGRKPMFISFYFNGMNIIIGIVPSYTWLVMKDYIDHPGKFSVVAISVVINLVNLILSFVPDNSWIAKMGYERIGSNPCPETLATYPSRVFFLWMFKLMVTGFKREITAQDVWDLNPRDEGCRLNTLFNQCWKEEVDRVNNINGVYGPSFPVSSERNRLASNGEVSITRFANGHHKKPDSPVYYDGANETTKLLQAEWSKNDRSEVESNRDHHKAPNLFRVLARLFWKTTLVIFCQKVIADITLFLGPVILGVLIQRLQFPDEERVWQSYTLTVGLVVTGMVKSILFAQSMYRSALLGLHVRTSLVCAIYKKALTISSSAKQSSTVGEIVNLMSVDCQRLQDCLSIIFYMWTTPLQLIIAVVLLYLTIGPAVLTGFFLLLLTVPMNMWVGKQQKQIQDAVLERKDERIKLVNQILNGMKVLKLYAWEEEFKKKVEEIRHTEIKYLYKIAFLYVFTGLCWGLAPFLVGLVTFATYVLIDKNNVLDPQKAFVSLALFNILRVPLTFVSTIIMYTVQISVSVKRVNKFLISEDIDMSCTIVDPNSVHAISIRDGTFTWNQTQQPTLKNINGNIAIGKLTAVVGPVGSGKTSLISAILGEMVKQKGQVTIKGSVAYVSQQAWIQNATVRDNILFGKKFNKRRYDQVIKVCELQRDLEILDAGDETEIGEKGINLSGGQKQRVNLARAVYSDSDIFLFDDPLSAVDSHVGKAIFKNVVSSNGVLAEKTRVLVTHGIHFLPQVDNILVLSNGTISERGSYEELISHNGPFSLLLQTHLSGTSKNENSKVMENKNTEMVEVADTNKTKAEQVIIEMDYSSGLELNGVTSPEIAMRKSFSRQNSVTASILVHQSLELSMTITSTVRQVHPDGGKLILEEKLETGKVKSDVFVTYGRAAGLCAISTAFLSFLLNQGFLMWSSFFLTEWTEDPLLLNATTRVEPEGLTRRDYYLTVYGAFFGFTQLIAFSLFNWLFWYRMVRAADRLHHLLLDRLFHAPMSFFDQTPIGRILNRFSKDVDTVDNAIPLIIRDWLMTASAIFVTLIIIVIQTPIFFSVLIPLGIVFYAIQNYYVRTSRQLKRIESITRSPIYIHFSESITGAAVIRAYGATDRFIEESVQKVDKNQVYFFASQGAIRWLQLNMDILSNVVVLFAAIFQIASGGGGSDAGLSVSYALQISSALTYMVRQISEFETNIVSVERMKEYSLVEQEAPLVNPTKRPSPSWPNKGEVTFTDYQTRYRKGLDLVLKGVTCDIKGEERIGIVGRTGAGKSSLTLCLFRILEAVSGSITIDGINIADIGLHDLRSKLTILPQDPVLFSGSLRMNIDPFQQYTDEQLWQALERSHLKKFVASQPDKLMYECGEEGANLSIGQRQLVCLTRALLRHTKILILDEATAAIDMETDALIQKTIREAFSDCTIIAIAHRINTIMDYDKVIVMDDGIIVEFDSPQNLINARGIFYSMCRDSDLA